MGKEASIVPRKKALSNDTFCLFHDKCWFRENDAHRINYLTHVLLSLVHDKSATAPSAPLMSSQPFSLNFWFLALKTHFQGQWYTTLQLPIPLTHFLHLKDTLSGYLYVGAGKRSKVHKSYVHSAKKWVERYKDHSEGSLPIPIQPHSWGLVYKQWGGRLTVAEAGVISPGLERTGNVGQKKPATWAVLLSRWKLLLPLPPILL